MSLHNSISPWAFPVYGKTHCGLKFHLGQNDQSQIQTAVKLTSTQFMWMRSKNWPGTEMRFSPEVKFQAGFTSLRVSCKRAFFEVSYC